ncbi:MAG TPA: 3-oxoacyl-ACP reductase FabG [Terriglobia bacterium]|nr:3-oxoacyl-ACP reductase FabG [Terriglobia bacterium]
METGLRGKVVIVTGAAAGIGRATARCFAAEGTRIAAWDVRDSDAASITEELRTAGGEGLFRAVNVTEAAAIESGIEEVLARWGRIDVLVNNAGIVRDAQLVKWKDGAAVSTMGEAEFDAVVAVNLKGVFLATRAVVPHMVASGGGVVLSASSVSALYGSFGQTNYAATKAGVIGMTRSWARELGRYNIRVNAVAPGFIATDMLKSIPPKVLETAAARTPLGRLGRPEDVAAAYVWLASDAAAFVHGIVLSVDGGVVLGT